MVSAEGVEGGAHANLLGTPAGASCIGRETTTVGVRDGCKLRRSEVDPGRFALPVA